VQEKDWLRHPDPVSPSLSLSLPPSLAATCRQKSREMPRCRSRAPDSPAAPWSARTAASSNRGTLLVGWIVQCAPHACAARTNKPPLQPQPDHFTSQSSTALCGGSSQERPPDPPTSSAASSVLTSFADACWRSHSAQYRSFRSRCSASSPAVQGPYFFRAAYRPSLQPCIPAETNGVTSPCMAWRDQVEMPVRQLQA
jgi:hypothetical protein